MFLITVLDFVCGHGMQFRAIVHENVLSYPRHRGQQKQDLSSCFCYSLCGHGLQNRTIVAMTHPSYRGMFCHIRAIGVEADDKQTIFKLIDKMLTNKKFKDFFAKNVATL